MTISTIAGSLLALFGLIITIVFWIPGVIDRAKLKTMLGNRYPLVYFIYSANGPLLFLFGLILLFYL